MSNPSITEATPDVGTKPIKVWINVEQLVADEDLDEDDLNEGIQGHYEVTLTEEAGSFSRSKQAAAALDLFHGTTAIAVLDDFEIEAVEEDGSPIEGVDEHESYSWRGGGYVNKIDDQPKY